VNTVGLIGGLSWESTVVYYELINRGVRERLGGLHAAPIILWSFDFAEIERLQADDAWDEAGRLLASAARELEEIGADCLAICSNTMHRCADAVEDAIGIPLLHLADATADAVHASGVSSAALFGTRYTMEEDFYRERLASRHGLDVRIPDDAGRDLVHRVIYDELCQGVIREESKQAFVALAETMAGAGAEALILGCTEVGLLVQQADVSIPLFDTTDIHARADVDFCLS
jgi:aspartate racemase